VGLHCADDGRRDNAMGRGRVGRGDDDVVTGRHHLLDPVRGVHGILWGGGSGPGRTWHSMHGQGTESGGHMAGVLNILILCHLDMALRYSSERVRNPGMDYIQCDYSFLEL